MNSFVVSVVVFVCVFGGSLLGMYLRVVLPKPHLIEDSKDTVKIAMSLVATTAALVLGLLVSSAKSSFDAQNNELTEMSAKVVLLDRVLARYGPETKQARQVLRSTIETALAKMDSANPSESSRLEPQVAGAESLFDKIQSLSPKDDEQRSLQFRASNITFDLLQTRWLMYEQASSSLSLSLLVVLIFWLSALFVSFGMFAPTNGTVVTSFLISAISVAAAIFLIVEMYEPYMGVVHVSSAPVRAALSHLGR